MLRIDIWFLLLASAALVGGVAMGIGMGISHDFTLAPVHAHLNLLGWASCAIFALAYRAWPALAATRLARAHLMLALPSAILFPVGIWLAVTQDQPALAILAALLWQAGAVLFLVGVTRLALGTAEEPAPEPLPAE